ncbi:hypothetical protein PthBH41_22640 [Parageobacillus thermoglucosidasius]|nr:hypothetical protein PthBH41_22640 [Parageobacillus thermoglucosidasius]
MILSPYIRQKKERDVLSTMEGIIFYGKSQKKTYLNNIKKKYLVPSRILCNVR